jgi:hypothetical protein
VSIAVPLDELGEALAAHPWGYLLTVNADAQPRVLAVPTDFVDGCLRCVTGRSAREHVALHPSVTMVFPPHDGTGFSLIVDGVAELHTESIEVRPTWAVLHRPALAAEG